MVWIMLMFAFKFIVKLYDLEHDTISSKITIDDFALIAYRLVKRPENNYKIVEIKAILKRWSGEEK